MNIGMAHDCDDEAGAAKIHWPWDPVQNMYDMTKTHALLVKYRYTQVTG